MRDAAERELRSELCSELCSAEEENKVRNKVRNKVWPQFIRFLPWLIPAVGIVAYAGCLAHPFLFDDAISVTGNAAVRRLWPVVPTARWLVGLSFSLNYALSGYAAPDFRAVNVAIHVLAGLALYGILWRTLRLPGLVSRFGRDAPWLAALAAALWTAHPLQTESVTYICQRYETMMGLFFLLSLYTFVRGVTGTRPRTWFGLSFLACALGMGTKEIIVGAPILILLYDAVFVGRSWRTALRQRWMVHLALFGTWGILAVLEFRMLAAASASGTETVSTVPPWVYLQSQFGVLVHYLRLSFWPHPLCLDYVWPVAERAADIVLPAIPIVALGVATLAALWLAPPVAFLGAWFFVILGPSSSVLPVPDLAFEHRMYLPLAAVLVAAVLGLYRAGEALWRGRGRVVTGVLLSALLVGAVVLTVRRNRDYRSAEAMWRNVIAQQPDNYRQHVALISALLAGERAAEAESEARRLVARTDTARARPRPQYLPWARDPAFYYGVACSQLSRALLALGRIDEGLRYARVAVQALPDRKVYHHNLAVALLLAGRGDEALAASQRALACDPAYAGARAFLAYGLANQGRYADAVREYRQALDDGRGMLGTRLELAWLLATCPDAGVRNGAEAIQLAQFVLENTAGRSVRALDVLAAAYAEAGQFDEAVRTARKAIDIATHETPPPSPADRSQGEDSVAWTPRWGSPATTNRMAARLALYRSGEPFRDD